MKTHLIAIMVLPLLVAVAVSRAGDITVIDAKGDSHPITAEDISKLPHQTIRAKAHDVEAEFSGVPLVDLLQSAGVEFGDKQLRGVRASDVALVEAADGYRTVFSLLELDPATSDKLVLLADKRDGKPLDDKEGPYRLVIPTEKRPVRWVRSVKTIKIVNLKDFP